MARRRQHNATVDCLPIAGEMYSLSARLAVGSTVSNEEITELLGAEAVPAFRHAQDVLAGQVRRTTGEPSFCHSADIAIRARALSYDSPRAIALCLLHDVAEDGAGSLEEVGYRLDELRQIFGEGIAHDVRLLTNRYAILCSDVMASGYFDHKNHGGFKETFTRQLDAYWAGLPDPVRRRFAGEVDRLWSFLGKVDLSPSAQRMRLEHSHTPARALRTQVYRLFVEELCDDAAHRFATAPGDARGPAETTLVCKLLDMVDNLRTSPVVIWRSLDRILFKTELFLDGSFYLHEIVHTRGLKGTFPLAYDLLKFNLVEQLGERRRALENLSDTRFGLLAHHLITEVERLEPKYRVEGELAEEIQRLGDQIRAVNEA